MVSVGKEVNQFSEAILQLDTSKSQDIKQSIKRNININFQKMEQPLQQQAFKINAELKRVQAEKTINIRRAEIRMEIGEVDAVLKRLKQDSVKVFRNKKGELEFSLVDDKDEQNKQCGTLYHQLSELYYQLASSYNSTHLDDVEEKLQASQASAKYKIKSFQVIGAQTKQASKFITAIKEQFELQEEQLHVNGKSKIKTVTQLIRTIDLMKKTVESIADPVEKSQYYFQLSSMCYELAILFRDHVKNKQLAEEYRQQAEHFQQQGQQEADNKNLSSRDSKRVEYQAQQQQSTRKVLDKKSFIKNKNTHHGINKIHRSFWFGFRAVDFMKAIISINNAAAQSSQRVQFDDSKHEFSRCIAHDIAGLSNSSLKKLYRRLMTKQARNFALHVFFASREPDKIGLKFDENDPVQFQRMQCSRIYSLIEILYRVTQWQMEARGFKTKPDPLLHGIEAPGDFKVDIEHRYVDGLQDICQQIHQEKLSFIYKEIEKKSDIVAFFDAFGMSSRFKWFDPGALVSATEKIIQDVMSNSHDDKNIGEYFRVFLQQCSMNEILKYQEALLGRDINNLMLGLYAIEHGSLFSWLEDGVDKARVSRLYQTLDKVYRVMNDVLASKLNDPSQKNYQYNYMTLTSNNDQESSEIYITRTNQNCLRQLTPQVSGGSQSDTDTKSSSSSSSLFTGA